MIRSKLVAPALAFLFAAGSLSAATTDLAGNALTGVPYTSGETYIYDNTPPAAPAGIDLAAASDTGSSSTDNITNDTTPTINGTGEVGATVTLYATDGTTALGTGSVNGSGDWSITASVLAAGVHTLTAKQADAAGNVSAASTGLVITIDTTAPGIVIGTPSAMLTRSGPITFEVTYSDTNFDVSTLATNNITLNKTSTADGTLGVSGTGTTRTVTISSITGNGTLGISIAAGTATDLAGNAAPVAGPSMTFTVDNTVPAVATIVRAANSAVNTSAASVVYRVTFSENVGGVDSADFTVQTLSGTAAGTVASVAAVSGSVYDVTVNGVSGLGVLRLDLNASSTGILDTAGNALSGGFAAGDEYLIGTTNVFDAVVLPPGGGATVANVADFRVAQPFTTSASAPLTLYYVAARIATVFDGPIPVVTINADNSGSPGAVIATLTNPTTLTANSLNVWTTNTTLAASTAYWLVFGDLSLEGGYVVTTTAATVGALGTWVSAGAHSYAVDQSSWSNTAGALRVGFGALSAAAISSVTAPANGAYRVGTSLDFTVTYAAAVDVVTTGGSPTLALVIGSTSRDASYVAAESTATALRFRYTVQAGENDADGIVVNSPLVLNGGTIKGTASVDAQLTFSAPNTASVLVDNTAPTVSSVTVPANGTYVASQNFDFTVNFSETISVTTGGGTPLIAVTIGATTRNASYLSGSGTTALTFRYTIQTGDIDSDGIAIGALDANGGTLRDAAGNDATLALNSVGATAGVLVDAVAPTIASVTVPGDAFYRAGQTLAFTVNYSENVTVNTGGGTPRLTLTIGATTRHASYVSGTGSSSLVFNYTIQAGDTDGDGIDVSSPADANGGTLRDAAGNNAALAFTSPTTTGVKVDTSAPAISIGAPSASNTRGGPITFTVTYSDTNFNSSTLATGNLTLNTTGTASGTLAVSGSGSTRTVTVSNITGDGTLGISIAWGTASDLAGNSADAAGPSSTFEVDNTAPTIATISRRTPSTVNTAAATIVWRLTFSEDVTGVDATDFVVTKVVGSPAAAIGSVTAVNAATYDVEVGSVSGQGRLRLDLAASGTGIADIAGNAIDAGGFTSGDFYLVGVANVFDTISLATGTTRAVSHAINARAAQRFTTAADAPLSLTTITASLGAVAGNPIPVVTIHADAAGAPGATVVATLTNPASLTADALNVWTSTQLLAANTTFWVLFADDSVAGAFAIKETAATTGGVGDWLGTNDYVYRHGLDASTGPQSGALQMALGATSTPTITSTLIAGGTYGAAFGGYTITASNLPASFAATGLPPGLTLESTSGSIAGTPTQAGTFNVSLSATNGSGTGVPATLVVTVDKASLTVTANSASRSYGVANPAFTVSTSGFVLGDTTAAFSTSPTVSTAAVSNSPVGTYALVPDGAAAANYSFIYVNGVLAVTKATATVTLTALNQVYNGSPIPATIATTPSGLAVTVTYDNGATAPTTPGAYAVVATVVDSDYSGSASGTLTIGKAAAAVTLGNLIHIYNGSAKSATANTFPSGLATSLTYNGSATAPSAVGNYAVVATINDALYHGSASGTLTIGKTSATVALGTLSHTYSGTPKSATATTTPAGLPVTFTYNGSASAPTNAGSYTVAATINAPSHTGSVEGTLTIAKSTQTIVFALATLDPGAPISLDATASSGLPVTFTLVSGPATLSGGALTATGSGTVVVRAIQAGNENYEPVSVERSASVSGKLAQTITFPPIAARSTIDGAFSLSATASSALTVRFTVMSGPAVAAGRTLILTGAPGAVTVRASQAGNATYAPAADVFQTFEVRDATTDTFFGDLIQEGGATIMAQTFSGRAGGEGPPVAQLATNRAGDFAAAIILGTRQGTLLLVAPAIGLNLSLEFTLKPDGTYTIPFTHGGQTITVNGALANGMLTGNIPALFLRFATQAQSRSGPMTAYSGFYTSDALGDAQGGTFSIVGTNGRALVLAVTPGITMGGVVDVGVNGSFSLTTNGTTIRGAIDASTATISGAILMPGQTDVGFSGLRGLMLRTDRLINLSSRARIGPSGDRTLITGFVIDGGEAKRVLLRATGPALVPFGVSGAAANPRLQLYRGGELILENDDWTGEETAAAFSAVGAFGLANGSRDAALLTTLAPGAYTMHVTAESGTGVALAEIYDASSNPPGEFQRLINISSRGMVEGGDGVLIGGFVVTGNSPKRVLIRGVGDSLSKFGLSGTLRDPQLTVFQGQEVIARNDNWGTPQPFGTSSTPISATTIAAAAQATGAFALDANSKDAVVILTLAPGAYTAQVTSGDTTSGIALVEIYEIPEN